MKRLLLKSYGTSISSCQAYLEMSLAMAFACFVIEREVMAKHGNTSHCGWCIE
ncbi:hypothetical protein [Shewanella japonica]|uniref:hypothetical protein n=1 Tax=Shewanella japonica TaxID=93973 RepID=UPI001431CDE8|nr:hypothetical protein [Shewanella japonica]